jgi:hypothetical protein
MLKLVPFRPVPAYFFCIATFQRISGRFRRNTRIIVYCFYLTGKTENSRKSSPESHEFSDPMNFRLKFWTK